MIDLCYIMRLSGHVYLHSLPEWSIEQYARHKIVHQKKKYMSCFFLSNEMHRIIYCSVIWKVFLKTVRVKSRCILIITASGKTQLAILVLQFPICSMLSIFVYGINYYLYI